MAKPLNILVADDDADNAESLGELFAIEGHVAQVLSTAEGAAQAFKVRDYDIAFLDTLIPGKDGVDSFLEIRKPNPGVRSYMMSGHSIGQLLQEAAGSSGIGIVSSPFDPDMLLAKLRDTGPCGIVLVDDENPSIGQHLVDLLNRKEYAVEYVTTPDIAFEINEERRVHVLVLDLGLPVIDALGVYRALKTVGRGKPTILVANRRDNDATDVALDDPVVTGLLTKPFDPRAILQNLERLAA
jgi:DNA-binding response OmpR family regulator